MLGQAKRVTIDKDNTTIVDGAGASRGDQGPRRGDPPADREHHVSDYDREKLQERLAKLAGGVAVIKVGGASEIEVKERKDRVDDALHATRAAVEEGIVPGGGTALLYATKALEGLKGDNDDQTRGIDIVRKALQSPLRQIAENAGHDGAVVAGKLLDGNDPSMGFNAQTEDYENLVQAGVIDPTKVVRAALQDAASVAGLLITTEAAISELPEDKPAMADGAAAAWAAWAEWTSKSDRSIRLIGRAGGAIRRPFFVCGHVVEHVLGLVELGRLLGGRRRRAAFRHAASARSAQKICFFTRAKYHFAANIKKGPPRRTALSLNAW